MNKEKIFDEICKLKGAEQRAVIRSEKMFFDYYSECIEDFKKWKCSTIVNEMTFSKKLWHYLKNDPEGNLLKCEMCGNKCKYISFSMGYRNFCSKQCAQKSENTKQLRKNSVLKKYGCGNIMQNKEVNQKRLNTNKEKYNGTGFRSIDTSKKTYNTIYKRYKDSDGFKKQISNKLKSYTIEKYSDVIGHENNLWICSCTNNTCNKCKDKTFKIKPNLYHARNDFNSEKCTKINPPNHYFSILEKEIFEYIFKIYNGKIIENERHILNGKEIDIYLPDLRLGFEFNGDFWHMNPEKYSECDYNSVTRLTAKESWKRDKMKRNLAESKNIVLVTIWESEWKTDKDKVKKIILEYIKKHIKL